MHDIKSSLLEIGLPLKEADVYLAMLELGPASVQDIAKKAGINRTTTYVMLEGLQRRGLMSSFEKGKKTMFVAENPERLISIINEQISTVEGKRSLLQSYLPRLLAIFNAIEDKPKVRFFEGEDSLTMIRNEMSEMRDRSWEFYAVDENTTRIANIRLQERIEITKKMRDARLMMAFKPGAMPAYFDRRGFEVRTVDYNLYPFSGSIHIAGHKICIVTTKTAGMGIVIESKEISEMFRAMFEFIWQTAKVWTPPAGWERN